MKYCSKFFLKYIWRWKFEGELPLHLDQFVMIVAPHTSWQDFPLGLLIKWSKGFESNYIGKDSLFKGPLGFFFRWTGGTPVDRSKSSNMVEAVVKIFKKKKVFRLVLAPEGTRKKVDKWKTGFYYIAQGAKVPIVMMALDFENRIIKTSEPYQITNDMEQDFKVFEEFYKGIKGYHPHLT